jgi:hypothetical protein
MKMGCVVREPLHCHAAQPRETAIFEGEPLNLIELLWRKIKYEWLPLDAYLNFKTLTASLFDVLNCTSATRVLRSLRQAFSRALSFGEIHKLNPVGIFSHRVVLQLGELPGGRVDLVARERMGQLSNRQQIAA